MLHSNAFRVRCFAAAAGALLTNVRACGRACAYLMRLQAQCGLAPHRRKTMQNIGKAAAGKGPAGAPRTSRWPARLDLAQSGTGLVLALFMWVHMMFVSSILLGKDAMWTITKMFEGYFIFGRPYPWLVSVAVAGVSALLIAHAAL